MKSFHIGAITCFALAFFLYGLSWLPGAIGLSLFGTAFEIAAWVQVATCVLEERRLNGHDAPIE